MSSSIPIPDLRRILWGTLGASCFAALILVVWGFVQRGLYPYDIMPDEGLMTLFAARLLAGEGIYATDQGFPYLYNGYAPVTYLILAPLVWMFGPQLIVPRLLSFLATLGLAALATSWSRRLGGDAPVSWVVAVGIMSCPWLYKFQVVARPDALSVLAACGLAVYLDRVARPGLPLRRLALAVGLGVVACFTKQNNVVLVSIAFLATLPRLGHRALAALVACAAICAAVVMACDIATAGAFWHSLTYTVLHSLRVPWKLRYLWEYLGSQAGWLALLGVTIASGNLRRRIPLVAWGGLGVGVWQLLEITRAGAGPNYFLQFHFFALVVAAVGASELSRRGGMASSVTLTILVLQIGANAWGLLPETRIVPAGALAAAARLEHYLEAMSGPVLLDRQPQLLLQAGKGDHYVDLGALALEHAHGRWHPAELMGFIAGAGYSAILLRDSTLTPPPLQEQIFRVYAEAATLTLIDGRYHLLLPREGRAVRWGPGR